MAEALENNINVLSQKDLNVPDFLDFQILRKEGLEHIGNLSGKIWTDHNVHDPGITMLEVLVYALMDLGYKTNLPFKDLVATTSAKKDDNFLTPLEILTVNPTTITDYRKLLLEIDGVKNAWLEPSEQEVPLSIDAENNKLHCNDADKTVIRKCNKVLEGPFDEVRLNGIYKVLIEKDTEIIENSRQQLVLKDKVRKLLAAHRNLCEDFKDEICVLRPIDIGICAEVEIASDFNPQKVYAQLVLALKDYVEPPIKYYTLQELLGKGKTIDQIFAGRPYMADSYGFVDTEELEALKRRDEMYLSDLYTVILAIPGVVRVKKVHFKGGVVLPASNSCASKGEPSSWVTGIQITEEHVPVFSLSETCLDLYSVQGFIPLDKEKVHQGFSFSRKFHLPSNKLNTQIPSGAFITDLDDYYSIQNDFPVVYGIGDDGLPENASLERKTQALQLKGYLMFYDQMLANYTAQLAHIRSLYALTLEKEKSNDEKRTYFTQLPNEVPGLNDLLQFYEDDSFTKGTRLAMPVLRDEAWNIVVKELDNNPKLKLTIADYCDNTSALLKVLTFSSAAIRSIYINQLVDSFFNEQYRIEVLTDSAGHFFTLCPETPSDVVLVGEKRYETHNEALTEAQTIAFLCGIPESYRAVSDMTTSNGLDPHYFNLNYSPLSYITRIQEFSENKNQYLSRRKQFLDHLLARFGEEFTTYTLLQYQNKVGNSSLNQQTIEDQSSYLNQFAEISRNRARAFDYLKPSWNTDNVSGFEKRISLLAGISNYDRRNLCNYEVLPCFRLQLKDSKGNVFFRSNRSYENKKELHTAARKILSDLRKPESYDQLEKTLNAFNRTTTHRLFSTVPATENIVVARSKHRQQLIDEKGNAVIENTNTTWRSKNAALDKKDAFITHVNTHKTSDASKVSYHLIAYDENRYIDTNAVVHKIDTLRSWKWRTPAKVLAKKGQIDATFSTEEEAWKYLIVQPECQNYLTEHTTALQWNLTIKGNVIIRGVHFHADKNRAIGAWRRAKMLASDIGNYELQNKDNTLRLRLLNAKGKCIAVSDSITKDQYDQDSLIADCCRVFDNRNTKPRYEKVTEKYGFRIPKKNGLPMLVSYNNYNSEREALEHMREAYIMGQQKKNYLLSGDQGNPEYNFILKDASGDFLAVPPEMRETAADRNKLLNTVILSLKKGTVPVAVEEEPPRYMWSLIEDEKTILKTEKVFSSKGKATNDLKKHIVKAAREHRFASLEKHCFELHIKPEPASYNFVYGNTDSEGEFSPIFRSKVNFKEKKEAENAYSNFTENISSYTLKTSEAASQHAFEVFGSDKKTAVAVQYKEGSYKASIDNAKAVITHLKSIYTNEGSPSEEFISEAIAEHEDGRYEWRFYKKNTPIALSPYGCSERAMAQELKAKICELIPPIALDDCPPKAKVVCPDKNPGKFHYQVCFEDESKRSFVLISYWGYDTKEAAANAWEEQWLQVISLARDEGNYGAGRKISLEETYKEPTSNTCDDISFMAVVPAANKKESVRSTQSYYTELANLFPIYQIETKGKNSTTGKFIYRVTIPNNTIIDTGCEIKTSLPYKGTLLWESEACFDLVTDAIKAYQHFYTLAGTPNNCRVLCKQGLFAVGLLEVLVESSCDYISEEEAWDDIFPDDRDECGGCIPGGIREFIYAAEDDKNYIPICEQQYWKFKVASPSYFIADHDCYYHTEKERDEKAQFWKTVLKKIDWGKYLNTVKLSKGKPMLKDSAMMYIAPAIHSSENFIEDLCDFVQAIRNCKPKCTLETNDGNTETAEEKRQRNLRLIRNFVQCLPKKYSSNSRLATILEAKDFDLEALWRFADYFPIYKTEDGYCYRLYLPLNDKELTPEGLQPCGCSDDLEKNTITCGEAYPFVSSNCYTCCADALCAFEAFCAQTEKDLIKIDCIEKTPYGPFSFRLVNEQEILGCHPQRYNCKQEVLDAIARTKACVDNTGMHLLEHILLRPKSQKNCDDVVVVDVVGNQETICCLLPICPDYCCDIEWQPDLDKDDPCADPTIIPNPNLLYYLPGSDPYSFWATLVLPAWDKRFRTEESRKAFEQLLYKEVPALVGLHILWLSPRDLCKFEDAYRIWLEWQQNQDPDKRSCAPNGIDPTCLLVDCIKRLTSEPPCPTIPGATGNCNCRPEDSKESNPCCLPSETVNSIFWGYCPPALPEGDTLPDNFLIANSMAEAAISKADVRASTAVKTSKGKNKKIDTKVAKEKKLLALVRKRKPKYLKNITMIDSPEIRETKSYERVHFFIENTATIIGYSQLVNYFNRYSLQKDNNTKAYLELIENATLHLFDKLILEKDYSPSKEDLNLVQKALKLLEKKGLSLKDMAEKWNATEIKPLSNSKTLAQLTDILK